MRHFQRKWQFVMTGSKRSYRRWIRSEAMTNDDPETGVEVIRSPEHHLTDQTVVFSNIDLYQILLRTVKYITYRIRENEETAEEFSSSHYWDSNRFTININYKLRDRAIEKMFRFEILLKELERMTSDRFEMLLDEALDKQLNLPRHKLLAGGTSDDKR